MSNNQDAPRYGGRALRNGVMMLGPHAIAVAVRRASGEIETAIEPISMPGSWAKNIPFLRGPVSMVGMLKLAKTSSRLEARLNPGGSRIRAILPQLAPGIGAALADRTTREMTRHASSRLAMPIETVAGVALPFVAFGLSGQLPGVRELWRYHGAEHKAVNAAEAGLELTPANAARMSRVHPRCGTVFAFFGILGGSLAKSAMSAMPNGKRKATLGLLSGPLVLSAAYEAVRLGWQVRDNPLGRAVFTPAWQSQRMTTAEPDERELEVAVAALQAVIDYENARATGVS
ncbi:MAG: DUF1385 domain-containing protein [Chloroflexota bacterium]